jgi:FAD/FMN-containing dehydrogenase
MNADEPQELRAAVAGSVSAAGDPDYENARLAWNRAADQRPAAVVEATGAEDIQAVVEFAGANDLRVAAQGTGHGAAPLQSLERSVLLKTSALRQVEIDPEARLARVGSGATAGELADAAGSHGLAPVAGFAPTVGVTGLTLGGGIGWLGRSHGLACNNVRAIELVTGTGELKRVDSENDAELFWALRGGGGSFGVVTAFELDLHPIAEAYAGMMVWPAERAAEVLEQFRSSAADAPDSFSVVFRYLSLPDLPQVPEPLRGRRVAALIAAYLGPEAEGSELVEPLRALGDPIVDSFGTVSGSSLVRVAGDPEDPAPALGNGFLLDDLSDELVAGVVERISGDALAPLAVLEIRHLGGALARAPAGHGCLAKLEAGYSLFATGPLFDPGLRPAVEGRLHELRDFAAPWTSSQVLLNLSELADEPDRAFNRDDWERLRRVHERVDPRGTVIANRELA